MFKIALVGNPNSGKTTLFNSLTGSTAHVGNWPGVTVDKKEGKYKKGKQTLNIVDLPGIYSLSPYTPEEVISRNFILNEKPDCVINIVDATNLERNLYLTTQLLEIDVPVVIALNMIDSVTKKGDKINAELLESKINVPVVEISALKETNLDNLMERVIEVCKTPRTAHTVLEKSQLVQLINDLSIAIKAKGVDNPLFHAIKLVEFDELEIKGHPDLLPMVNEFRNSFNDQVFGNDFEAIVADARYRYISANFTPTYSKSEKNKNNKLTRSDKIDRVLTNKFVGIPMFLLIMFLIFHFTFSEDLFFLNSFKAFGEDGLVSFVGNPYFEGLFANGGINSPAVILMNLVNALTGWLTETINIGLTNLGASEWAIGLVCEGILGGLFAILGFLPQILVLFLFFSILEDSGYMARVAFILDRAFRKFGLSGRAFMPMIMGFGCSVPAMVNTRTLASEKERLATVRVIPFFSCGAKLPILTAIAGGIATTFGFQFPDLITYSMYVIGIVVAIATVIIMHYTTLRGKVPPFIMELPNYHLPQFKSLMLHIWDKAKHFIKKAFTVILASTILVWFISHFSWNWSYLPSEQMDQSILASLGMLITPIFTPLGFGVQLANFGWVFGVAAITGLIAKENVIATFGTLAACIVPTLSPEFIEEAEAINIIIMSTGITWQGLISFIAFNMLTIPCFAACATAKGELSKNKFLTTILFWIVTSFVVSSMIYLVLSWVWTISIVVVLITLLIVFLVLFNKHHKYKEISRV